METKQQAAKQTMGQQWNQRGNQKIPQDKWKWKHSFLKPRGCSKNSYKREVHSHTGFPQETRKISNNLTWHIKELGKKNRQNPESSKWRK